ncbi:peptidoglycan DD-metalloendopeptidase family protein [Belliella sp. DSM 107340]|uniref:Peptidoglycan DD-metalloendopeptidase family protein n=1 Tax=Belliella calami TaxID=2923436 RepID=A0ABS9UMA6_9BACT|nr:peptidoglycan DD-metalloendopeptidase family protein [Belliella calami]MCH7397388.1 peptidoglycan DD-metalloendopeptidase family protein [Belliella calami]
MSIATLSSLDYFPIMGEKLDQSNTLPLDFSPSNKSLALVELGITTEFDSYVFGQLKDAGKQYGIGGYMEHRSIYGRSNVFATQEHDFRDIHLGIDIWAVAGHPVFAPLDGEIHSFQDNAGFGNYGPTIILQHRIEASTFYSLYGHLSLKDLQGIAIGQNIKKGDLLCHLGPFPENGDWPPHLHFQLMWDMHGLSGDFPGVCSHREKEKFLKICPDPNLIIGFQ